MIAECNYSFIFAAKNTIMSQTAVTIRIDSDIKNKFDELCNEFGMSVNTAFCLRRTNFSQQRRSNSVTHWLLTNMAQY